MTKTKQDKIVKQATFFELDDVAEVMLKSGARQASDDPELNEPVSGESTLGESASDAPVSGESTKKVKNIPHGNTRRQRKAAGATSLMKVVAAKTMSESRMKKTFTDEEIAEIRIRAERMAEEEEKKREENSPSAKEAKKLYRKMKRFVLGLEKNNRQKIILVPSFDKNGVSDFYKLFDFSALYYAHRLADRMGRQARVMNDNDRYLKADYVVSLVGVGKFIQQIKEIEGPTIQKTEEGIYILNLKKPLSDDELGELYNIENTRRERLHNVLRPKAMDPAVFQGILTVMRQIAPRVRKLEKRYYYAVGDDMLKSLDQMMACYFDFTKGVLTREVAGAQIMRYLDVVSAGLIILTELNVWDVLAATMAGENLLELERAVMKSFNIKTTKDG